MHLAQCYDMVKFEFGLTTRRAEKNCGGKNSSLSNGRKKRRRVSELAPCLVLDISIGRTNQEALRVLGLLPSTLVLYDLKVREVRNLKRRQGNWIRVALGLLGLNASGCVGAVDALVLCLREEEEIKSVTQLRANNHENQCSSVLVTLSLSLFPKDPIWKNDAKLSKKFKSSKWRDRVELLILSCTPYALRSENYMKGSLPRSGNTKGDFRVFGVNMNKFGGANLE
ncbi:hypothetical protein H5410_026897 [Solanum commersonii]|uniref:Uncharacterized protein n=1 Tax=Solanum commersonii TaxID=4109 RepID=A0A9J5YZT5_SOLCO|nr:hypothetical protein H5410_026897 [Solanum commersonii]